MRYCLSILFLALFFIGVKYALLWLTLTALVLLVTNTITAILATYRD